MSDSGRLGVVVRADLHSRASEEDREWLKSKAIVIPLLLELRRIERDIEVQVQEKTAELDFLKNTFPSGRPSREYLQARNEFRNWNTRVSAYRNTITNRMEMAEVSMRAFGMDLPTATFLRMVAHIRKISQDEHLSPRQRLESIERYTSQILARREESDS